MKIIGKMALIIAVLCLLCGCAVFQGVFQSGDKTDYKSKAQEHEFSYFFPKSSFTRSFATLEDAYDYVRTAQAKFAGTAGKPRAKGLTGKLIGSPPSPESSRQPVTVACELAAAIPGNNIDLTDTSAPMEEKIRKAISAVDLFMVFTKDRGILMQDFYLHSDYTFNDGNRQVGAFEYKKVIYQPNYPIGWNAEKAFSYLRGEID